MPNAAEAALLVAAALAIQTAWAADPAIRIEPAVSGSGAVELNTAPPALDGAQLFATHCAMCHKPAELARRLQSAADPEAARAEMAAFLPVTAASMPPRIWRSSTISRTARRPSSVEAGGLHEDPHAGSWLSTALISINERQIRPGLMGGPRRPDADDGDRRQDGSLSAFKQRPSRSGEDLWRGTDGAGTCRHG